MQPLWRTVRRVLRKLKRELPYDPAIPLLGIHPKELKAGARGDTCTPALFTNAKGGNRSMDGEMGKQNVVHPYNEYYSSLKRKGGFPGGAVVENLPANAGDTGSSPDLGRSHMPRSS